MPPPRARLQPAALDPADMPTPGRTADASPKADQGAKEVAEPTMVVRLAAETIGAFALTFVAAGADTIARVTAGEVSPIARAVAPGLLVMAFIYAIGDRSGAHFNPAVTLAFTIRRLFPIAWVIPYWLAQLVGAAAAGGVLRVLFDGAASAGVSTPHIDAAVAVGVEVILTALLVMVILGTADRYQVIGPDAAIAVGATIALCGLVALPLEGASMNPARSFGPAIATGDLSDLWIYVVGPVIGAVVAIVIATVLHGPASSAESKPREAARGKD
jgi:aquaporin Z